MLANPQAASNQSPYCLGDCVVMTVFSRLAAWTGLRPHFQLCLLESWVLDLFSFWYCEFYHDTVVLLQTQKTHRSVLVLPCRGEYRPVHARLYKKRSLAF